MFYTDIDGSLVGYYIGVYVMVFLFGICIGSFLNVCIYRLPTGESLTKQNSHCMTCGAPIKWYDLIPVFSWLLLRGKCRACGAKISGRYILVESLTGIIFTLTFMRFDVIEQGLIYPALICLFLAGVIVIGFEDFDTREMTVGVLVYLLLVAAATRVITVLTFRGVRVCELSAAECLIGLFSVSVPFLIFGFVLTPLVYCLRDEDRRAARKIKARLKKMKNSGSAEAKKLSKELEKRLAAVKEKGLVFGFGMGDVLLMSAGGLMFGWKAAVVAAFIAIILGAVYALAVKAKADESDTESDNAFAFGPFLALGLVLSSFFGTELMDLYIGFLTVPEIPMLII